MSDKVLRLLVKIERANQHAADLFTRLSAFFDTNPYQVVIEDDPRTGDRVFRLHKVADVPLEIAAAIGDIVHNLRASLDHLACQLVLANGETPTRQTAYPVCKDAQEYTAKRTAKKVKGMSCAAVQLIDATRPYKGGNDDLWRLNELDIIDKHRLLLAVGGLCPIMVLDFTPLVRHNHPNLRDVRLPVIPLSTTRGLAIVEDGAEIHRVPRFAEHPDMHTQPEFPPDVAVNEPTVGPAESVFEMLKKFYHLVGGIIGRFQHLL